MLQVVRPSFGLSVVFLCASLVYSVEPTVPKALRELDSDGFGRRAHVQIGLFSLVFRWCPAGRLETDSVPGNGDSARGPVRRYDVPGFWIQEQEMSMPAFRYLSDDDIVNDRKLDSLIMSCSWIEAIRITQKLSMKTGGQFRLPTSVEWEYAARCGRFNKPPPEEVVVGITSRDAYRAKTRTANPWGIFDMLGGLAEYSADLVSNGDVLVHGGTYGDPIDVLSYGYEERVSMSGGGSAVGFRLVCNGDGIEDLTNTADSLPPPPPPPK